MNCVSYTRTSFNNGNNDYSPLSIAEQNDHIKAFAKEQGLRIVKKYTDRKDSREEEGAFNRMRTDGVNGRFDLLITYSLCQCGTNPYQAIRVLRDIFYPAGIHFAVVEDGFCSLGRSDTEVGDYFASKWKEYASNYTQGRITQNPLKCCLNSYGYRYLPDENRLVIDEESAAVIREIYSKLLEGKLPREIAKELSERGVERPFDYYTRVNGWKPRTEGPEWPEDAVYKIGRNPKFCGRWEKVIDGRNVAQDCDPIVSPEDYEAVQKIFDSRRHHRIKVAHMENPLNRILTDQETGAVLILNKNKYTGIYDYHFRPRKPKGVKYERICMYYDEAMRQLRSLLSSEKERAKQASDFICSKDGIAFKEMMVEEIHSEIPVFMDKVLHIGNQKIQAEKACSAGVIDKAEYERRISDLDERFSVLDDEINTAIRKIRDIRRAFSEDNPWVKLFLEYDETEELTLKYVRHFVESAQMYRFETIILKTRESDWKQMVFNAYEGVYGNGKDKQTG